MVCTIFTMDYFLATRKNEMMAFATTWMDLEIIIPNEVIHKEKGDIWYHLYVESTIGHK